MSLAYALKWSFLSELAAKAIQPVVFIVLARLLTPEDFGVMSAALMVISFSQIFWEAGMGKALIQRQTDIDEAANLAFRINISLGVFIAALLFVAAGPIAQIIFHEPPVMTVLRVMTLQIFLGAISSVHTALLQKDMGFKKLFWVRFATVGLPGLASFPLAWYGMGYWALVAGTLFGQAVQVVVLWKLSKWRPGLKWPELTIFREMTRFGGAAFATAITAWFYNWADTLVIGYFLSTHEMGLYKMASGLVGMANGLFLGSVGPVLFSELSRNGLGKFKKYKDRLIWLAFAVATILVLSSSFIEETMLGEKWSGIGYLILILAAVNLVGNLWAGNSEGYAAVGRPGTDAKIYTLGIIYYLPTYLYLGPLGLEAFVIGRLFLVFVAAPIHIFYSGKLLKYNVRDYSEAARKLVIPMLAVGILIYLSK